MKHTITYHPGHGAYKCSCGYWDPRLSAVELHVDQEIAPREDGG